MDETASIAENLDPGTWIHLATSDPITLIHTEGMRTPTELIREAVREYKAGEDHLWTFAELTAQIVGTPDNPSPWTRPLADALRCGVDRIEYYAHAWRCWRSVSLVEIVNGVEVPWMTIRDDLRIGHFARLHRLLPMIGAGQVAEILVQAHEEGLTVDRMMALADDLAHPKRTWKDELSKIQRRAAALLAYGDSLPDELRQACTTLLSFKEKKE